MKFSLGKISLIKGFIDFIGLVGFCFILNSCGVRSFDVKHTPNPENSNLANSCGSPEECDLINKTNSLRQQNGLPSLAVNSRCVAMAQEQSRYMAKGGPFSHDRPNETFGQRAARFGIIGGENIAMGATSVDQVLNLWMNSSGHKANILNKSYFSMGAGYESGYWTQCFSMEAGNSH